MKKLIVVILTLISSQFAFSQNMIELRYIREDEDTVVKRGVSVADIDQDGIMDTILSQSVQDTTVIVRLSSKRFEPMSFNNFGDYGYLIWVEAVDGGVSVFEHHMRAKYYYSYKYDSTIEKFVCTYINGGHYGGGSYGPTNFECNYESGFFSGSCEDYRQEGDIGVCSLFSDVKINQDDDPWEVLNNLQEELLKDEQECVNAVGKIDSMTLRRELYTSKRNRKVTTPDYMSVQGDSYALYYDEQDRVRVAIFMQNEPNIKGYVKMYFDHKGELINSRHYSMSKDNQTGFTANRYRANNRWCYLDYLSWKDGVRDEDNDLFERNQDAPSINNELFDNVLNSADLITIVQSKYCHPISTTNEVTFRVPTVGDITVVGINMVQLYTDADFLARADIKLFVGSVTRILASLEEGEYLWLKIETDGYDEPLYIPYHIYDYYPPNISHVEK